MNHVVSFVVLWTDAFKHSPVLMPTFERAKLQACPESRTALWTLWANPRIQTNNLNLPPKSKAGNNKDSNQQ